MLYSVCGYTAFTACGKPVSLSTRNQDVFSSLTFKVVHDGEPELGAPVLADMHPQYIFFLPMSIPRAV